MRRWTWSDGSYYPGQSANHNEKAIILEVFVVKKFFAVFLALILTVAATISSFGAEKPAKVCLVMGYIPNVQFAPWYVAQEKGFFHDEGLDVNMDYGKVNDVMRLLATGDADLAIAGGDEVIVARGQGIPVSYVMALYARFPAALISLTDSGISSLEQLKGKSIGIPGFYGTNYIAVKAILEATGLRERDVTIRPIGYTQVQSLATGQVDSVIGFANNEPIQLEQQGVAINTIALDSCFDLVGHGVVVGENTIIQRPELVQAFVSATLKGMEWALANPREAFEICKKYIPELDQVNEKAQYQVLLASMELWESAATKANGLGYSDPNAWKEAQELMAKWGIIPRITPVEKLVTNEFLR